MIIAISITWFVMVSLANAQANQLNECPEPEALNEGSMAVTFWPERYGSISDLAENAEGIPEKDAKDIESALTLFKFYAEYYPSHKFPRVLRRRQNALKVATGFVERALLDNPCDVPTWEKLFYILLVDSRYEQLRVEAERFIERVPSQFKGYMALGLAQYLLEHYQEAKTAFDSGLALVPKDRLAEYIALDELFFEDKWSLYDADPIQFTKTYFTPSDPLFLSEYNERELGHFARVVYNDILFPFWRKHSTDEWLLTPGDFVLRYGIPHSMRITMFNEPTYKRSNFISAGTQNWDFTDLYRNDEYFLRGKDLGAARDTIFINPQEYSLPGKRFSMKPTLQTACFAAQSQTSGMVDVYASYGVPILPDPDYLAATILTTGIFLSDATGNIVQSVKGTFFGLSNNSMSQSGNIDYWTHTRSILNVFPSFSNGFVEIDSPAEKVIGRSTLRVLDCNFPKGNIQLSDPLVSTRVEERFGEATSSAGATHRYGFDIWPSATMEFDKSDPIYVYFEVYGAEGTPLATSFSIVPVSKGLSIIDRLFGSDFDAEGVSVSSDIKPESNVEPSYRILNVGPEASGKYVLGIAVRDVLTGKLIDFKTQEIVIR